MVIAIKSTPPLAAGTQLYVAAATLAVSAVAAAEWTRVLWGLAIALETALVAGVPGWSRLAVGRRALSWPLIVLALLGAGPWLVYAVQMWQLNRQDRADKDITVGIDHYSVQGGYGLAVVALVTIGAVWAQGRRFIGLCAGIATVYLGLISFVWHPTQGSFNQTWSVLCMLWGLAVAAVQSAQPPAGDPRQQRRRLRKS